MKGVKFPVFFASRYLFSKKTVNAINIISFISFIGVLVSSAALVIVLSFYNGMESFILSMYSSFTPDLRIEPAEGKSFSVDNDQFLELKSNANITNYVEVLEDKIMVQHNNIQFIGQLKGIENESFLKLNKSDLLQYGTFSITADSSFQALIGAQIQSNLQIPINDLNSQIELYFPRKESSVSNINPLEEYNIRNINVNGVLSYQPELDNLILVPMPFARDILNEEKKVSAIELYLDNKVDKNKFQKNLQRTLKQNFKVNNREQQNPTLYKTIKSEKWIVFFILTFIGIIAIFNIIGSLTMLVIDKKEDMKILHYLGAKKSTIENIFFIEGLMIAYLGSIAGIGIGYLFCTLQENYGFIRTGEIGTSLIDIYPIDIRATDFILVLLTIFTLSSIVSYFASKLSVKNIKTNT